MNYAVVMFVKNIYISIVIFLRYLTACHRIIELDISNTLVQLINWINNSDR